MKYLIFCITLIFSTSMAAQSTIESGFRMLETGKFEDAKTFFKSYLEHDSTNKTAILCYGRAVGLSGEPKLATSIFSDLLKKYPDDYETQVNYNESFLWNKDYEAAKPLYKELVELHPDKFSAVLGLANTLSNLKEFEEALKWANAALVLDSTNESAKISKKYIKLGYANEYVTNQDYFNGKRILEEIFIDFPEDKDALLNLANLYLITKDVESAKRIYWRYATSAKDSVTARNGIALAEHINENDAAALHMAEIAITKVEALNDYQLTERTQDRYVQALIWNHKYNTARKKISNLEKTYGNTNWLWALKATLSMYTADFKSSLKSYEMILEKDSTSFDGNLGKANALFASGRIVPAYQAAFQTLSIFKNQKDAKVFIEKLNVQHTPWVEEHAAYTFDNGNNVAFSSNTTTEIPWSTKFRTTLSYQFRNTENTLTNNKAKSHVVLAGLVYKVLPKTILKTVFGINNSRFTEDTYTQPVFNIKLQMQPFKLQNLDLSYQREVQSFNADLIEREIVMNHYGLNYNLGTNFKLGWYTQLIHTQQTDNNTRNLLFTSLYYSLFRKPALKVGLNYQYLTFEERVPNIYFSPSKYQVVEFFTDLRGKFSDKTTYMASLATGLQQVEEDSKTNIFRAEAGIQHQFSKRLSANLYGKYSNIASATAAGFEFTEVGIKLKWMLTQKPVFWNKMVD